MSFIWNSVSTRFNLTVIYLLDTIIVSFYVGSDMWTRVPQYQRNKK